MLFFDCDTQIGRSYGTSNLGGHNIATEDLTRKMDQAGVGKAVVFHTLAREYHPAYGNELLPGELKGYEARLYGCWVLLPHHTGEMDHISVLVRRMHESNIRVARIFPSFYAGSHRFELADWCIGDMLAELEKARIPLMIDFALFRRDQPPFRDIYEICKEHPNLPVILMDVQARNNRSLYPLLEKFQNLHIQTAAFYVHRGVEHFVENFGSERLIFGSGFPVQRMGSARFHIERAMISETHRERIAGGNLIRLLESVKKEG